MDIPEVAHSKSSRHNTAGYHAERQEVTKIHPLSYVTTENQIFTIRNDNNKNSLQKAILRISKSH
jgi:hypothetical protein